MLSLLARDAFATLGELLQKRLSCGVGAEVEAALAEMALCLEDTFWVAPWFQAVLRDNQSTRDPRTAEAYAALPDAETPPWRHALFFLYMWRNSVTHARAAGLSHQLVSCFRKLV